MESLRNNRNSLRQKTRIVLFSRNQSASLQAVVRARPILSVLVALVGLLTVEVGPLGAADIYRLSMDVRDGVSLEKRAEFVREQIPTQLNQRLEFNGQPTNGTPNAGPMNPDATIGQAIPIQWPVAQSVEQSQQLLPGQSPNPLMPDEPRFSQIPDGPAWAAPPNSTPDGTVTDQDSPQAAPSSGRSGLLRGRRIKVDPRGGGDTKLRMIPNGPDERAWVVNSPTQITLLGEQGPVELSADRIVVWTDENVLGLNNLDASAVPIEIYLEGNIEVRQGGNLALAQRMYYDAGQQSGVILEAEVFGEARQQQSDYLEDYRTPYRMRADVIQQISPTYFQANNAAFTTSRLGQPQYWLESETLTLDTGSTPLFDQIAQGLDGGLFGESESDLYRRSGISDDDSFYGKQNYDDSLGLQSDQNALSNFDQLLVSSENSRLFVGGVPILRWPRFSTDLANNPSLYLDRIRVGSDSVFGQQLLTRWNNFQLLGRQPPPGVRWTTDIDYLTERGLGFGTDLDYRRNSIFGRPAMSRGYLHSWFINDDGRDNLGFDRRSVAPEESFRGRIDGKHMHLTPSGWQVIGEIGWISDRNLLEQFFEEEWDLQKDKETRLELKRYIGSSSWSIGGSLRLNDFVTQTEWLPRADHYELGRSLLGDRLTWYEHSQIGYARLRTAGVPTNPDDLRKFDLLAGEESSIDGIRAVSRQEVDMPFNLGPLKVVPYVLGEIGHWHGEDATRLLGQGGIRASMLMWTVDPTVYNELFNLNGVAHKVVFDSEFMYADANKNYEDLPLLDPLDDDSVEFFRRRFLFDTFGLGVGDNVPLRFDERNYAFRQGLQRYVASPSTEIADDLMMLRVGMRQRIQTRRGKLGSQRIVDWMTFDIESHFFPRASRDNFGQEVGPTRYDFRWHVGDRTTLMSDGYIDFFGDGLRTVSLGAALTRPGKSQYFVGLRSIEGPISSNVLTGSIAYRMSPKWKFEYGTSIDFSGTGNIGQSGRIVRIGESLLVGLGAYYDASRNNFGFRFDISGRVMRSDLGMIGGRHIAPVGVTGLE